METSMRTIGAGKYSQNGTAVKFVWQSCDFSRRKLSVQTDYN